MRKLDVKEIHGYNAAQGLKLIKPTRWPSGEVGRRKRRSKRDEPRWPIRTPRAKRSTMT